MDKWRRSSFLDTDEDPLGPLANLIDIVLVFACGLIAALVAFSSDLQDSGKVFTLDQDASFDITLPTAAAAGAGW